MAPRPLDSLLIGSLRLLPRNAMSRAAGRFFSMRLPASLQRLEILALGKAFGVDFSEVRDPIDSFGAPARSIRPRTPSCLPVMGPGDRRASCAREPSCR